MVKSVIRAVGKGDYTHIPFPKSREAIDIKRFVVSYEKIETAVDWQPKVALDEGVQMTADFYNDNLKKYLRNGG